MTKPRWRMQLDEVLLTTHLFLFALYTVYIFGSGMGNPDGLFYSSTYTFYVAWSVMMFMHVRLYYVNRLRRTDRRRGLPSDERRTYREGYNDALEMLRERGEVPEHLMIDGELIEDPAAGKRKYR